MLEAQTIYCPYCGENIDIWVDCSVCEQTYIEDCSVCCRPIYFAVKVEPNGHIEVIAKHENE